MRSSFSSFLGSCRQIVVCVSLIVSFISTSLADGSSIALASWTLDSSASVNATQAATTKDSAIASASLVLGTGVKAGGTSGSFGGSGFSSVTSAQGALDAGTYIEASLTVASGFSISLNEISYKYSRSSTGPTNLLWVVQIDGGELIYLCEPFIYTATSVKSNSHSLQTPITVNGGSTVRLLFLGWDATKSTGTLYIRNEISLVGTVLEAGYVPPSIDAIADCKAELGTTLSFPISISGDIGSTVETNVVATTAGVEGNYCLTNGVFSYTPAASDLALSPVGFTISLSVNGTTTSKSFQVTVWERPDFFETFEKEGKTSYGLDSIEGVAATWYGTNYVAQGTDNDYCFDERSIRLRGDGEAYIEMITDKAGGAGTITLTQGRYKSDTGTGYLQLFLSNNKGETWNAWQSELITVSEEFTELTFEDVNIEGSIRLRIVLTGDIRANIDNIGISNYGELVDDPEEEVLTELPIAKGASIKENFNTIGASDSATLPLCWRMAFTNTLNCFTLDYASAAKATEHNGGLGVKVTTAGLYNFGDGDRDEAIDRAPGFLSSSSNYRSCALMVPVKNVGNELIQVFRISYAIEKYRTGRSKKIELRISRDGKEWSPISNDFFVETVADDDDLAVDELPPPTEICALAKVALPPGEVLYFGWFYYSNSSNSSSAQALAIDDIRIRAGLGTILKLR